jgi:DeoR/GlpR family transcriptional regulator of sugar metabolism
MLEERLIRKLNYLITKKSHASGRQLTPKIPNLSLLRNVSEAELKKEDVKEMRDAGMSDRIGCVLYVDEENTSKTCPECGFEPKRNETFQAKVKKSDAGKIAVDFVFKGKTYRLDDGHPYILNSKE